MIRYSDLLKHPQWTAFRADFIQSRHTGINVYCDSCGEDTISILHVHHRFYDPKRMPWEYHFDDMRLCCQKCHQLIHDTEEEFRNFIRALPPDVCYEAQDLLACLRSIEDPRDLKVALARAKSVAKDVLFELKGKAQE